MVKSVVFEESFQDNPAIHSVPVLDALGVQNVAVRNAFTAAAQERRRRRRAMGF